MWLNAKKALEKAHAEAEAALAGYTELRDRQQLHEAVRKRRAQLLHPGTASGDNSDSSGSDDDSSSSDSDSDSDGDQG
ncbi:hypothetical protein HYH02_001294 [Chlamydomonas schloesseri]|uniref:Uncharacterized protein n=1 Tax=Chlamydomonas schloesseri TaxID=2026947 RepID=A0A835WVN1_9CHLO|nr:hypothetical protein HYH02_012489 [Chlamydomonas schloesseri]KAG2454262.1 hypothetical protein HYH02_001294 [Chlamydomonas schloesseri]|eukprot:KAG2433944.1 hypothetical protein HYH02_012489 [Chlamydomonas schloesseri]